MNYFSLLTIIRITFDWSIISRIQYGITNKCSHFFNDFLSIKIVYSRKHIWKPLGIIFQEHLKILVTTINVTKTRKLILNTISLILTLKIFIVVQNCLPVLKVRIFHWNIWPLWERSKWQISFLIKECGVILFMMSFPLPKHKNRYRRKRIKNFKNTLKYNLRLVS